MTDDRSGGPRVWPGDHRPLGATYDGAGTNFAVWAPAAEVVHLCLFDEHDHEARVALCEPTLGVWHGYVPDIHPGQRYGYRAEGRWDPQAGLHCDVDKLLLDPYARAVDGTLIPHPTLSGCTDDGRSNRGDTAPYTPRSVVVTAESFDWGDDRRLDTPWPDVVIYEAHVKGLTVLNPDIPWHERGCFAAVGHPSTIAYLKDLGVTAIELLPTQHFLSEPALSERGLVNYWGYNPIGFFAPHAGYSSTGTRGQQVTEFKQMVKNLHAAGLEVIVDVVYNHTAEADRTGPTVSLRGLDDRSYYRADNGGGYADVTGCGNTVQVAVPQVLRLVMDSLRYWVQEMHVDGFRFDLASALTRNGPDVDVRGPFLAAVHQDPVLREVKLIAEPWDATGEGYLTGRFPAPWCEWNDRFRDSVRDFWRGRSAGVRELASRVSGSSDLYAERDRWPFASVNFLTSHDGFPLRDLVTYDTKHNQANGEDNRDGTDDNRSWNCGVEGETDDQAVNGLRHRQAANMLSTLLLSTGVPMLTSGDERGRTQRGNNNAFCQDNETSWMSWRLDPEWRHLHDLTRTLLRLRSEHPVFGQRRDGGKTSIVTWLQASGLEMTEAAWRDTQNTTLGVFVSRHATGELGVTDDSHRDQSLLLWFHAGEHPVDVVLPEPLADHYLEVIRTDAPTEEDKLKPGSTVTLLDRTFAAFEAVSG